MKKILICVLSVLLLCSCSAETQKKSSNSQPSDALYVKAVWITYYELQSFTENCNTAEEFKEQITDAFDNLHDKGFNTVTVQVRPCADAFYNSSYFPVSQYCFGEEGSELKYDPLLIMCEAADSTKMRIEAWVNPYRVSQQKDIKKLSENNIAKKWYEEKNGNVYIADKAIYFNPASEEVKELIVNGVTEIVKNYEVDAIHFDDYFYPTTDKDIDKNEYDDYKDNGGELGLAAWRRENVSDMIKSVYSAVKKANKNVLFGISPAAGMKNDYESLYADVYKWTTEEGYCDYICPQVYFGFLNDSLPFMKTVKDWRDQVTSCSLYIGLPLYKCGKVDEYAGRGENEFKENSDMISRQIKYIAQIDAVSGYYVFSYSYLQDEDLQKEVSNLYSAMQ